MVTLSILDLPIAIGPSTVVIEIFHFFGCVVDHFEYWSVIK